VVADKRRDRYSVFADSALAAMAAIAGADGVLGKHELGDELWYAIRRLVRGHRHLPAIPPTVAGTSAPASGPGITRSLGC